MGEIGTSQLSNPLASLNTQQRAAAEHRSGPVLVIAGAGTGKTKTLAARVAYLLGQGTEADRILLLTFTRRAATEMIRRAGQAVGQARVRGVWAGTFHAIAYRLLRTYSQGLGLDANLTVMDPGDAEDLLHLIRTDLGFHKTHSRFPQKGTLLAIYSRCVNAGEPVEKVLAERFPWCLLHAPHLKRIFQEYSERKAGRALLDYDDLLFYWEQALDTPGVAESLGRRFEHVLVDEYQDTNPVQAAILRKLWERMKAEEATSASQCRSIMAVGDDAQSIYSFRGATVENMLHFADMFPGTATVTLEQNYRSVQPILDASNRVMEYASRRFTKNLWSERASLQKPCLVTCAGELEQGSEVADRVLAHREEGVPLIKQAVLFRAGQNSDMLEVELSRRNIPFVKWGGLRFLETAHVKDMLAFLRIAENPKDDLSWMRVLQMLEGIGPGRARQAVNHVNESGRDIAGLRDWRGPAAAQQQLESLAAMLMEISRSDPALSVGAQVERIRSYYSPFLEGRYDQPEMRRRDLDQLELLARHAPSRAAFLTDLTLDPPTSTGDLAGPPLLDEEYLVLSTIHSAKGCEWDIVYLIHAADGVLPSDMSTTAAEVEEERRLLYVAMTRARDRLIITFPLRYYHRKHALGDSHSYAQLSRFLPPELFPYFERSGGDRELGLASDLPQPATPLADTVQERLRRLWE